MYDESLTSSLKSGEDVTIFSTGSMVYESLEAEKILQAQGISCSVIDVHTIKPIEYKSIINIAKKTGKIFVIEEHQMIGGLRDIISNIIIKTTNFAISIPLILKLEDLTLNIGMWPDLECGQYWQRDWN